MNMLLKAACLSIVSLSSTAFGASAVNCALFSNGQMLGGLAIDAAGSISKVNKITDKALIEVEHAGGNIQSLHMKIVVNGEVKSDRKKGSDLSGVTNISYDDLLLQCSVIR